MIPELWQSIIVSILGGGLAGAGIARFLAKKLVEHALQKEIEQLKAQLSERTEMLKSHLSIRAHEENVALTRVDGVRSAALHSLFTRLLAWNRVAPELALKKAYTHPDPESALSDLSNAIAAADSAVRGMYEELMTQAIFIDTPTYDRIHAHVREAARMTAPLVAGLDNERSDRGSAHAEILSALEPVVDSFASAYRDRIHVNQQLAADFRRLIGTERQSTHVTAVGGETRGRGDQ